MKDDEKFVVQKHSRADDVHWDLMLQTGEILETYRLEMPPEKLSAQKNPAVKIFDHPLKFLTYEGSVNNGKGQVEIADSGTYRLLGETENRKELQISGRILDGKYVLTCIKNDKWEFALIFS